MHKFDGQINELKGKLNQAQNILIALSVNLDVDILASGLSFYLSLKQSGKSVEIVTLGTPLVAHSNLFGIGSIKHELSKISGNLNLSLEGVVKDGTVPSLEKLDWYPEGENLNLVFHVLPGQKFEPRTITPKYSNAANFSLIFVIGANSLKDLGEIYQNNTQVFSNSTLVNIDRAANNSQFGKINLIDKEAGSISEIIMQLIYGLGLKIDQDIASNLLAGIYFATNNLTTNVKGETFIAIGQAMQLGGKTPSAAPQPSFPSQLQPQPAVVQNPAGFDLTQFILPTAENFTVPQVAVNPQSQSSEERPSGEQVSSRSPESPEASPAPDWLTPKVYKGGGLG